MKTQITPTSVRTTDVFGALGFPPQEAANLRIRSTMMTALTKHIKASHLTQAQAAKLLGVTQPRISALMQGKIYLFSIDNLVSLLSTAGLDVKVRIKTAA